MQKRALCWLLPFQVLIFFGSKTGESEEMFHSIPKIRFVVFGSFNSLRVMARCC